MVEIWGRAPERYARIDERGSGIIIAGTPADAYMLRVIDEETDEIVEDVVEVNCNAGWLRRHVRTECGQGFKLEGVNGDRTIKVERIEGKFRLERRIE